MGEQKKKRFHMPHAYTLIFLLIVLVAVLTWIIPSGEFQRTMVETSTGEREVVVAGTYHGVSKIAEDGTNLRQGIQAVLTAPALGIQNAIEVIAFVFIIGGVFQIMAKTNALNMGIRSIIDKLGNKEFLMIPILMTLFGLGGTTYGMSDELVPFYLLVMPIMSSLCDLHGANPEAAVTVLQYANQLTNMMSPVAGTTVAGLAVCRISFSQWWKTIWKVFVVLTIIALVFCAISAGM